MSLRKKATSGFIWTIGQQFGNQIIGFIVSVILARLLLPAEFGLVGMIAIFIAVGKVLIDSGFTQSIIRSEELDQEDYSTIFFFNLGASILLYLLLYTAAPFIAEFYDQELLINLIRVFGITFIINAFTSVQKSRLTKIMDFKTQMIISLPSTIFGGIVGIWMAYTGFGVWSLIWSSLSSSLLSSIQLWIYSKWHPSFVFNVEKFKKHFSFGYKLTIASLLDAVFNNLYLIIIGRFFSASQVGYYTRAESTKNLPVQNLTSALTRVTFPMFAGIQNNDKKLKEVYGKLMQMVVFVVAPLLIIMAILAEPSFRIVFGEKWLPAVPYFQILCLTGILYPLQGYNINLLKVKGRSDLVLKVSLINKGFITIGILIGIQFGIFGLLYAQVILSFTSFFVNSFYAGKFINYPSLEQLKDILPIFIVTALAGFSTFLFDYNYKVNSDLFRILLGGFLGSFVFILTSVLLKLNVTKLYSELIFKRPAKN